VKPGGGGSPPLQFKPRKGGVKVITFNQVCIAISAIAAVALKLLGKTDDSVWFLCVLIYLCLTEERIEKKEGRD
jgi:hypothetical protein